MSTKNLDQLYRSVIMDHYKNPRNKGVIEQSTVTVDMNNPTCGDVIHLTLTVEEGIVQNAKFEGEGCSISMASASMMTQMIKGRSVKEAEHLAETVSNIMMSKDYDDSIDLGDLESLAGVAKFPARIKCATLSWKAMEKGVRDDSEQL